jgi:membrane-bound lytic murein transglycosylase D
VAQIPQVIDPRDMANLFDRMRTGFALPDDVADKSVDRELDWYISHPDYLDRTFDRADPFLYQIVTMLESRAMPREIALLPVVESAFEPYAYSVARASGLWQFIPGTGSRYSLRQDWWYDGRRDVLASTRAALDYLSDLYIEFNDWLLAIAAYNCGEMNVERAIARNKAAGQPIDFWHLKLPAETRAYVPKLLAMKRLVANPEYYGLAFSPILNKPYFTQVDTRGQISMKVAAQLAAVTVEELYQLNPAYHRWATQPTGPFNLLVPVDAAEAFNAGVVQLTDEQRLSVLSYTVAHGDSLNSVAKRFGTTAEVVRQLNDLPNGPIVEGSNLLIPSDSLTLPAKALRAAALVDGPQRRQRPTRMRITVRKGETLYAIARRTHVDVRTLARQNGLDPDARLKAGQQLSMTTSAAPKAAPIATKPNPADDATAKSTKATTQLATASRAGAAATTATRAGQSAGTGADSGASPTTATATSRPAAASAGAMHTVKKGETLYSVAKTYRVSVDQLSVWNSLSGTRIVPGQKLLVRQPAG